MSVKGFKDYKNPVKKLNDGDGKPWHGKWIDVKPEELDDVPNHGGESGTHWGYHLLVDCSDCDHSIDDVRKVELFVKELVRALKMKPLGDPMVIKVDDKEDGRGVTAVQVITTSTITFHGDNDKWSVYLDVFSCAPYEPKVALNLFTKYFEPKHLAYKWILRDAGNWPRK